MSSNKIRKKIELIKKQKLLSEKVVSLEDFKKLCEVPVEKSVLVVDDDEVMRNAIPRILGHEGYKVTTAGDGLELSKTIEDHHYDLILLDIELPWVDGFELCRLIKGTPSLKNIPLVLISGRSDEKDIREGFAAGADDYITKPFEIDHITALVEKHAHSEAG